MRLALFDAAVDATAFKKTKLGVDEVLELVLFNVPARVTGRVVDIALLEKEDDGVELVWFAVAVDEMEELMDVVLFGKNTLVESTTVISLCYCVHYTRYRSQIQTKSREISHTGQILSGTPHGHRQKRSYCLYSHVDERLTIPTAGGRRSDGWAIS